MAAIQMLMGGVLKGTRSSRDFFSRSRQKEMRYRAEKMAMWLRERVKLASQRREFYGTVTGDRTPIGSGCDSEVYDMPDPGFVMKVSGAADDADEFRTQLQKALPSAVLSGRRIGDAYFPITRVIVEPGRDFPVVATVQERVKGKWPEYRNRNSLSSMRVRREHILHRMGMSYYDVHDRNQMLRFMAQGNRRGRYFRIVFDASRFLTQGNKATSRPVFEPYAAAALKQDYRTAVQALGKGMGIAGAVVDAPVNVRGLVPVFPVRTGKPMQRGRRGGIFWVDDRGKRRYMGTTWKNRRNL